MPIHVTTSTTQSLSNKTFVDRVSTTGVVYASSGNSNQWSSTYSSFNAASGRYDSTYTTVSSSSANWQNTYTTVRTTSGGYITNIVKGINSEFNSTGQGLLSCTRPGGTFTVDLGLDPQSSPTFQGLIIRDVSLSIAAPDEEIGGTGQILKLYGFNAVWYPDTGESAYTTFRGISSNLILGQLGITIDGAGSFITTGIKQYLRVPYNCNITSAEIVADAVGSIDIDIYKSSYANFPPTVSIITGSGNRPALNGARTYRNTTLTGWVTALSAGEYLGFDVISRDAVKKVSLTLVTRR